MPSTTSSKKTKAELMDEMKALAAKLEARDEVVALLTQHGVRGVLDMEADAELDEDEREALEAFEKKLAAIEEAYVETHLGDPYDQSPFWETFPEEFKTPPWERAKGTSEEVSDDG